MEGEYETSCSGVQLCVTVKPPQLCLEFGYCTVNKLGLTHSKGWQR